MVVPNVTYNNNPFRWLFVFLISLALLGLFINLASCNVTKKLNKDKVETKAEVVTEATTTRTITETGQGEVKIASDSLESDINFDNLIEQPFTLEDGNLRVDIDRDPKTHKVHVKAKSKEKIVPVNISKVTVENEKSKTIAKADVKTKSKVKDKKVESGINWNYIWWLLLLLLIPIWKYRKALLQ